MILGVSKSHHSGDMLEVYCMSLVLQKRLSSKNQTQVIYTPSISPE